MEQSDLISEIEERQRELALALVSGVADWETYLKIVNQHIGLENAKSIIHEVYIRLNNGENESKDEF